MNKKVFILKILIDNFVVSVFMSLTASLLSGIWDMFTFITIPFSFVISTISGFIIPLGKISNWFSSLFKIKPNTLKSELVGGLLTNVILTTIISFSCKLLVFSFDIKQAFTVFISTYLVMYLVSYVVYEISNYLTNELVKKFSKKH